MSSICLSFFATDQFNRTAVIADIVETSANPANELSSDPSLRQPDAMIFSGPNGLIGDDQKRPGLHD
jgi:hypothetical protein